VSYEQDFIDVTFNRRIPPGIDLLFAKHSGVEAWETTFVSGFAMTTVCYHELIVTSDGELDYGTKIVLYVNGSSASIPCTVRPDDKLRLRCYVAKPEIRRIRVGFRGYQLAPGMMPGGDA
jgi:hypothetical protein